ncbi:MAG TPA: hypothetical protein VMV68_06365 [Spirochaetia bacterium]|nr:hypothetical protein [Spirochaetia bacterium]
MKVQAFSRPFPRSALVLLLLGTLAVTAHAIDLSAGQLRLTLYESTGRFSLSTLTPGGAVVPLFYAQDPRTTVLSVRVGDEVYRMGDSQHFKTSVKQLGAGAQITWTSGDLTVTERFDLVTSVGANAPDGLRIAITLSNISSGPLSVGARYVLDTYLGEQSRIHFMTDSGQTVTTEMAYDSSQMPAYWLSPKDSAKSIAFEVVTKGQGVTTPDRLVFSNWKRLNDSEWEVSVEPGRAFNLLPYSINDSAAALFYNPETLAAGATRTINMLMGDYAPAGWPSTQSAGGAVSSAVSQLLGAASQSSSPAQGAPQATGSPGSASTASAASPRSAVEADLSTVQNTVSQIDKMLSGSASYTQSDIDALTQALDKLSSRKNSYASQ